MNRFEQMRIPFRKLFTHLYSFITFILLIALFLWSIHSVDKTSYEKQQESLENALNRSIFQCYALEGIYPPSLEYIKAHYGLTYDESIFFVDYNYYGANLLPEVVVIRKEK